MNGSLPFAIIWQESSFWLSFLSPAPHPQSPGSMCLSHYVQPCDCPPLPAIPLTATVLFSVTHWWSLLKLQKLADNNYCKCHTFWKRVESIFLVYSVASLLTFLQTCFLTDLVNTIRIVCLSLLGGNYNLECTLVWSGIWERDSCIVNMDKGRKCYLLEPAVPIPKRAQLRHRQLRKEIDDDGVSEQG